MNTAWLVYLGGQLIGTVHYPWEFIGEEVRRSLIEHEGYDPRIVVLAEGAASERDLNQRRTEEP